MIEIDMLVKNIRELVNPAADTVARGSELNAVRVSHNVWVGAAGEDIVFIGREEDFNKNCRLTPDAEVIDGSPFVACPGFVDPHTHLPFAGTRQDEFRLKLQGVTYQEIAAKGGGIKGTVRKTRAVSAEELIAVCDKRLDHILAAGTTTMEAKSGYGLDLPNEIKQLDVIAALNTIHPIDIIPTFMGPHEVPEEFKGRNMDFLDYMIREVAPAVHERRLAVFADIFCEEGVFSYPEAEYYFRGIEPLNFKIKMHADEFTSNNAATLAVNLGAVSAEHLIAMTSGEIETISASDTACVFLPGVSFFLKMPKYAPLRQVIEQNGIVALGTDFNPGSSMVSSQLFVMQLGIFKMGMTVEEALNTVTINAAYAVDRHDKTGSIAPGKKMDLLLMDIPDYSYMAYHLGINPIHTVIKAGETVIRDRRIVFRCDNNH